MMGSLEWAALWSAGVVAFLVVVSMGVDE